MRRPDTAYVNGKVYTVDGEFSVVSAFCVEGDRFVAAGRRNSRALHARD